MKISKSVLFALFFGCYVLILACTCSCSIERDIEVREMLVKVTKLDTVYRLNGYNEYEKFVFITCEDARGVTYTINPPKPLQKNFDWIGEFKIVYLK